jgi:hypothetical protein
LLKIPLVKVFGWEVGDDVDNGLKVKGTRIRTLFLESRGVSDVFKIEDEIVFLSAT